MTRDALQRTAPSVTDAAVGLVTIGTDAAGRLGRRMRPLTAPLFRAALDPPLLPATLHPSRLIDSLARRGAVRRVEVRATAERWLEPVVPAVVDEVLDKLDLTALVLQRVDLDAVLQEVLARLDLVTLAEQVIDEVDLPEIVRESSGAMASETVQAARMQGIAADQLVARLRSRLRPRPRAAPAAAAPGVVG